MTGGCGFDFGWSEQSNHYAPQRKAVSLCMGFACACVCVSGRMMGSKVISFLQTIREICACAFVHVQRLLTWPIWTTTPVDCLTPHARKPLGGSWSWYRPRRARPSRRRWERSPGPRRRRRSCWRRRSRWRFGRLSRDRRPCTAQSFGSMSDRFRSRRRQRTRRRILVVVSDFKVFQGRG